MHVSTVVVIAPLVCNYDDVRCAMSLFTVGAYFTSFSRTRPVVFKIVAGKDPISTLCIHQTLAFAKIRTWFLQNIDTHFISAQNQTDSLKPWGSVDPKLKITRLQFKQTWTKFMNKKKTINCLYSFLRNKSGNTINRHLSHTYVTWLFRVNLVDQKSRNKCEWDQNEHYFRKYESSPSLWPPKKSTCC